jgi:uncharacterized membrane protein YccF (DUF307 family)
LTGKIGQPSSQVPVPHFSSGEGSLTAAPNQAMAAPAAGHWPTPSSAVNVPPPPQSPFPTMSQSVSHSVNVNVGGPNIVMVNKKTGPNLVVRAIWFWFFGSWMGALTILVAILASATVIGLPLAFWLYNRVPSIATLRPRTEEMSVRTSNGVTFVESTHNEQYSLLVRVLYFFFVGWWLAVVWYLLSLVISIGIVTMPISVLMLDRIGAVATLHKH